MSASGLPARTVRGWGWIVVVTSPNAVELGEGLGDGVAEAVADAVGPASEGDGVGVSARLVGDPTAEDAPMKTKTASAQQSDIAIALTVTIPLG
ncbi:MAG: hypothetical protein ABR579_11310 [Actinomycetota bacterium]